MPTQFSLFTFCDRVANENGVLHLLSPFDPTLSRSTETQLQELADITKITLNDINQLWEEEKELLNDIEETPIEEILEICATEGGLEREMEIVRDLDGGFDTPEFREGCMEIVIRTLKK